MNLKRGDRALIRRVAGCCAVISLAAVPAIAAAHAPNAHATGTTAVQTRTTSKLKEPYLAAANGRTLYEFNKDSRTKSNCTGGCAKIWKPYLAGGKVQAKAGSGLNPKLLKAVKLRGGRSQVSYAGHLLYEYTKDTQAGQLNGQDLQQSGGSFYVLGPKGEPIVCQLNVLCGY